MGLLKREILVCILVILFSTLTFSSNTNIKIVGHSEFAPISYTVDEKLDGLALELVSRILSDLKIESQIGKPNPWPRVLHETKEGTNDLVVGVYKTSEEETYLDFVPTPFIEIPSVIFTNKESFFTFKNWYDLVGFIGGRVRGTAFDSKFEDFIKENSTTIVIEDVRTVKQNFLKLLNGRIDYFPYSKYTGMYQIEEMGISEKIEESSIPLTVRKVYLAFSKNSSAKQYIDVIDEKIKEYKKNGIIEELLEKHSQKYLEIVRKNRENMNSK